MLSGKAAGGGLSTVNPPNVIHKIMTCPVTTPAAAP